MAILDNVNYIKIINFEENTNILNFRVFTSEEDRLFQKNLYEKENLILSKIESLNKQIEDYIKTITEVDSTILNLSKELDKYNSFYAKYYQLNGSDYQEIYEEVAKELGLNYKLRDISSTSITLKFDESFKTIEDAYAELKKLYPNYKDC